MRRSGLAVIVAASALASGTGCLGVGPASLELSSAAFGEGERIPTVHTCDGKNVSPPLGWSGPPDGTVSLALLMDDPDARGWVHWVLFDLPPDARGLPEGVPAGAERPAGGIHGRGNAGAGYFGPCPPEGAGAHRYSFRLYALDARLGLPSGSSKAEVEAAMQGHVLAAGTLIGSYERP